MSLFPSLPDRVTPIPQSYFNDAYGGSLISCMVMLPLYGVSVLQTYMYFLSYESDPLLLKLLVFVLEYEVIMASGDVRQRSRTNLLNSKVVIQPFSRGDSRFLDMWWFNWTFDTVLTLFRLRNVHSGSLRSYMAIAIAFLNDVEISARLRRQQHLMASSSGQYTLTVCVRDSLDLMVPIPAVEVQTIPNVFVVVLCGVPQTVVDYDIGGNCDWWCLEKLWLTGATRDACDVDSGSWLLHMWQSLHVVTHSIPSGEDSLSFQLTIDLSGWPSSGSMALGFSAPQSARSSQRYWERVQDITVLSYVKSEVRTVNDNAWNGGLCNGIKGGLQQHLALEYAPGAHNLLEYEAYGLCFLLLAYQIPQNPTLCCVVERCLTLVRIMETFHAVFVCHAAYYYTILSYSNPLLLTNCEWLSFASSSKFQWQIFLKNGMSKTIAELFF
ncbi:hypothetical protein BU17DRAFT_70145 [Hysterangium stoloniferum]|nr:hypothetical protein BU17DRAFT_70145 [Hysterangium stoloniferum]